MTDTAAAARDTDRAALAARVTAAAVARIARDPFAGFPNADDSQNRPL